MGSDWCKTSEDFGTQGEWPSHPELLDDLTIRFMRSAWDVKALVRSIVLLANVSAVVHCAGRSVLDRIPRIGLLARGSRFRLDAEMIRDQILAVSGLLNPAHVRQEREATAAAEPVEDRVDGFLQHLLVYGRTPGDKIYRRSVYSFWKRAMPPPQMTIFDAPTRESCIARRERTNTPLQALVLMNEEQYFKAARHFARELSRERGSRVTSSGSASPTRSVTSQLPDDAELARLRRRAGRFPRVSIADQMTRR